MSMSKESCYEETVETDKASGRVIRFWVVIGILALAGSASGALSVDEQVKMLTERCEQIETQLDRSVHITSEKQKRMVRPLPSRHGSMARAI
jgi:hypothetical protein